MPRSLSSPTLVRLETALAVGAAFLSVLTLVVPDWIEAVFRIDPDGGDGSLEWLVAGGFALLSVVLAVLARRTFVRIRVSAV